MDEGALDIPSAVHDLYVSHWGVPSREAHFERRGLSIDVLKWDADANPEEVALYATVGTSAFPQPGIDPSHRIEFFLGLQPARDEVAGPLAALGLYSKEEDVGLDHGHTVPGGFPWPGTDLNVFLISRQDREILLPTLLLGGGVHVEFLMVIPISTAERDFKAKNGLEALMARFESTRVPFWDPNRKSVF